MPKVDVSKLTVEELLGCFADVMDELKARDVVRSYNNPTGDYAEWLVCQRLGLTAVRKSTKGYDATDPKGRRYQIKSRRIHPANASRQLSAIRNLNDVQFDYLIAVIFDRNFQVAEVYKVPHEIIGLHARYRSHVNAHILHAQGDLLKASGVEDITEAFRD